MSIDDGRPHQKRGPFTPTGPGFIDNLIASAPVKKDTVVCKADGLGSFKCFSRDMKPRIRPKWYPKSKRFYWVVERDMSIKWKHLTEQEKNNLHAAYEYVKMMNQRYEETL